MNTKETVLEKRMKKSELKADCARAYAYLTKEVPGLLPCKIEEDGEEISFIFDVENMHPFTELKAEEKEYKYRFLQNFWNVRETWGNYSLTLTEDNIFYDNNFIPYIAFRDIKTDDDEGLSFLEEYQLLAAGVLNKRYTYTQVRESGMEILRRDKSVAFISDCETEEALYEAIKAKAEELHEINKNQKIRVDKKKHQRNKGVLAGIIGVLVILLVITGYQTLIVAPRDRAVIRASRAYTVENYVDCIDYLRNVEIEQMDTYTKYILAVSYARSEALEKEELTNVLSTLSIYSNEIELEYWIAIGRSDHARAENIAKALSDDKLLIYAYMKELNYLEGNVTMDGEEKQSRMNELGNAITEIGKKYTEEE